jgi:fumarate reductase subunit D
MKEKFKTMFWQLFSEEPMEVASIKLAFLLLLSILLTAGILVQYV